MPPSPNPASARTRTDIDEILPSRPVPGEVPQPVAEAAPKDVWIARTTTDPLQINFATADLAEAVQKPNRHRVLRLLAVFALTVPSVLVSICLLQQVPYGASESSGGGEPFPLLMIQCLLLAVLGIVWPILLVRRYLVSLTG